MKKIGYNNNSEVKTINSREVAVMVDMQHGHLIRKIESEISNIGNDSNIGLVEFFIKTEYKDSKGETRKCYELTKKGCEVICCGLTGEKGAKFRNAYVNRFNEMEKVLSTAHVPLPVFDSKFMFAIGERMRELEEAQALLTEKIEEDKPKVSYAEDLMDSDELITTTKIAKQLGISAAKLNNILVKVRILYRTQDGVLVPYAAHQDKINTHFRFVTSTFERSDGRKDSSRLLKWTNRGAIWIKGVVSDFLSESLIQ